ncbi:hypothetical protein [Brevundimonas goettingensis]|nr:hypothetical protein [Brevundimonas goettingensis]
MLTDAECLEHADFLDRLAAAETDEFLKTAYAGMAAYWRALSKVSRRDEE